MLKLSISQMTRLFFLKSFLFKLRNFQKFPYNLINATFFSKHNFLKKSEYNKIKKKNVHMKCFWFVVKDQKEIGCKYEPHDNNWIIFVCLTVPVDKIKVAFDLTRNKTNIYSIMITNQLWIVVIKTP